jgi:hypothetical protein
MPFIQIQLSTSSKTDNLIAWIGKVVRQARQAIARNTPSPKFFVDVGTRRSVAVEGGECRSFLK